MGFDIKIICLFVVAAAFVVSIEADSIPPTGADNGFLSDWEKKIQAGYEAVVEKSKEVYEKAKDKVHTAYDTVKEKAQELYKEDIEIEKP